MHSINKPAKVNRAKRLPTHTTDAPSPSQQDDVIVDGETQKRRRRRVKRVRRQPRSQDYQGPDENVKSKGRKEVAIESAYGSGDRKMSNESVTPPKRPAVGRLCNMKRLACFGIIGVVLFLIRDSQKEIVSFILKMPIPIFGSCPCTLKLASVQILSLLTAQRRHARTIQIHHAKWMAS